MLEAAATGARRGRATTAGRDAQPTREATWLRRTDEASILGGDVRWGGGGGQGEGWCGAGRLWGSEGGLVVEGGVYNSVGWLGHPQTWQVERL